MLHVVGRLVEVGVNRVQNAFDVLDDFVILKTSNSIAPRFKKLGSAHIALTHLVESMVSAVNFDHNLCLMAGKICEIGSNWSLAAEMTARNLDGF
jgi:hypothetical protein